MAQTQHLKHNVSIFTAAKCGLGRAGVSGNAPSFNALPRRCPAGALLNSLRLHQPAARGISKGIRGYGRRSDSLQSGLRSDSRSDVGSSSTRGKCVAQGAASDEANQISTEPVPTEAKPTPKRVRKAPVRKPKADSDPGEAKPTPKRVRRTRTKPISDETDPSAVPKKPTPKRTRSTSAKKEPVSAESEPVSKETKPVPAETKPISAEIEPTPVESEPTPLGSEPTKVESEPIPVENEATPVESEPTPVESEPIPVASEPTPVKAEPTSVETKPAPVESKPKPTVKAQVNGKAIDWPSPGDAVPFWKRPVTPLSVDSAGAGDGGVEQDPDPMHIVHVTAEMAPLAKVGGLGDVVTGLARACIARGHRVRVLLPFYDCIDTNQIVDLRPGEEFDSFHRGGWIHVQVFRGAVSGVPVVFFKPSNHFFLGSRIYGGSYDELEAYLFFSRAVLEYFKVKSFQPDVIHIHEWHTSGVALLYWDMYHDLGLTRPRIALTIHNMEHHGECRREQLDMCGLDGGSYLVADKAIDDRTIGHNPERASLLKGGIVYSNVVTTVSPTYAEETLKNGWLSKALKKHRGKYHGVLNGIDTLMWDPKTDPHLPATFSDDDLEGKRIAKHYVQRGLGLETERQTEPSDSNGMGDVTVRKPLVVCITRLVAQKGVHLIRHAIFRTAEQGGQFVLLGSAADPRIQGDFQHLAEQFRESASVRLLLTYSESLAHLLFAAADVLLVPSMFEPCGLTQMIAMRYGTIPVVRRTGGLADTVFDVDNEAEKERANGYVFDGIGEGDLNSALDRALQHYKESPDGWDKLSSKVMKIDNSWNKSAAQYVELYLGIRAL